MPDQGESEEVTKFKVFDYNISDIKWRNVIFLLFLHIFAIYGFVHALLVEIKFFTVVFVITLSLFSGLGISVGMFEIFYDL